MGGSSSYTGGGGGGGITPGTFECGGNYEFLVIIEVGNEEAIWNECKVGQDVYIDLVNDDLPRLEVKRLSDNYKIGLVPPIFSKILDCIHSGWKYEGKIKKIEGSDYNPQIYIKVKGVN